MKGMRLARVCLVAAMVLLATGLHCEATKSHEVADNMMVGKDMAAVMDDSELLDTSEPLKDPNVDAAFADVEAAEDPSESFDNDDLAAIIEDQDQHEAEELADVKRPDEDLDPLDVFQSLLEDEDEVTREPTKMRFEVTPGPTSAPATGPSPAPTPIPGYELHVSKDKIKNKTTTPLVDLMKFSERAASNVFNAVGRYDKLKKSMTWRDGLAHCESKGKRLCMRSEYCPHGRGKQPKPGLQNGEAWAPVSDNNNDWVYIGDNMKKVCNKYTELLNNKNPPWGRAKVSKSFKGNVYCCDMKMKVMATTQPSWDDAVRYCMKSKSASGRPMRLCSVADYCPQGPKKPPQGGLLKEAAWAAVYDRKNEWVSVGYTFPKSLVCKTHRQIAMVAPKWGMKPRTGPLRGVVMCCTDPFITLPGKVTYAEAKNLCKKSKKRLCWADEYCPNGKGQSPRGGERPGEAWSPIGNGPNEWVQVGNRGPTKTCTRYSTWKKNQKPPWGAKDGTKGYIQCCSGPAPGSKRKKKDKGAGKSVPVVPNNKGLTKAQQAKLEKDKRSEQRKKRFRVRERKHKGKMNELRLKSQKLDEGRQKLIRVNERRAKRKKELAAKYKSELMRKAKKNQKSERARKVNKQIERARKKALAQKAALKRHIVKKKEQYINNMKQAVAAAKAKTKQTLMKAQAIIDAAHKNAARAAKAKGGQFQKAELYPLGATVYHPNPPPTPPQSANQEDNRVEADLHREPPCAKPSCTT